MLDAVTTMSPQDPWLVNVVSRMQSFAGEFAFHTDERDARDLSLALATSLPHPPDRAHNLLLATLLLGAAARISRSMHEPLRAASGCACAGLGDEALRPLVEWQGGDARTAFAAWISQYFRVFSAAHPPHRADEAARLLRTMPQRAWTLAALARAVHASATQLRSAFTHAYGMTPHHYLHTVRIARAIPPLAAGETAMSTARAVGYRSRKDFYRAFKAIVHAEPAALARMSALQRAQLSDRIAMRLRPIEAKHARHHVHS